MSKLTTLLVIALLVCSITLINAGRPNPTSLINEGKETEHAEMDENESCQGLNDEECLMRRTLVAHTDYIYTQHHNP
uniref:Phytosulfokine n=1 Tax=Mesembryanthemum crystallinum TaxID=3544 RepID=Q7PCA5_MESCR|nr:TPA_exp: putative phytosulfokine peptide precursor [Mesembryanthemum crystallinum]